MSLIEKNNLILYIVKNRGKFLLNLKEEVGTMNREKIKVLPFVLNIREKCGHRSNGSTVRIDNKSYNSNIEFNYNYNLKYTICKHRRRQLYTNFSSLIILKNSQEILSIRSKMILLEVFQ